MSTANRQDLRGLGFVATWIEATRQSLALLVGNRLYGLLLLGEVVAAIAAWGIAGDERNRLDGFDLYCLLGWWFQVWVVLPWVAIYLGVHAVHGEIAERTFHYLFLRPVRRAPLLLGKWLAACLLAAALCCTGAVLCFVAVAAHPETWSAGVDDGALFAFLEALGLGTLAYAACGACFGACCRRPLVWGAVFVVLQMAVALLPVSAGVRALTISDPLRRLLLDLLAPGRQLAYRLWPNDRGVHDDLIGAPVLALFLFTGILLMIALLAYGRSEYDSRHQD